MLDQGIKKEHMTQLDTYRRSLWDKPQLRNLFLELTLHCNENCIHCGSKCGDVDTSNRLSYEEYCHFLDYIKERFDIHSMMLCITGGEPLVRHDFFDIMEYANALGYHWGMTSNATLINQDIAARLYQTGMQTISVSIDGLKETHDHFRRTPGAYDAAMKGIHALISHGEFQHIQVTTVVHKENINELDELYQVMCNLDIDSWRVINLEPIGRAKDHPELLLEPEDYKKMFYFIQEKRQIGMPVTYGCSHYLGMDMEREVRDWYFLCNAGIYTASIMVDGTIGACLDIERRPELIQGNIRRDDFKTIWEHGFQQFRKEDYRNGEKCNGCSEKLFCNGGSFHSWDFEMQQQLVCLKGILF